MVILCLYYNFIKNLEIVNNPKNNMSSHPSCCNFSLLGNLFQQVVIELDYSVSKSQAFGLYRFTDLTHILLLL